LRGRFRLKGNEGKVRRKKEEVKGREGGGIFDGINGILGTELTELFGREGREF
jgi:hypothetical protein